MIQFVIGATGATCEKTKEPRYLGREGSFDDRKPTLREEEAKKLKNNLKKEHITEVESLIGCDFKLDLSELK